MPDELPLISSDECTESHTDPLLTAMDYPAVQNDHGLATTTAQPRIRLWRLPGWQARFLGLAFGVAILILFVRLYQLASTQTDLYGDIEIVYDYVRHVLDGEWPYSFTLSAGPLYHYLIAPIVWAVGLSYTGLKLASVIVSLGVLLATYALARRLVDDYFALLATAVAGMSSWLLIWSRLGNSQILVPLLTTAALWLMLRAVQTGRAADLVACAVVSALGLYTYPQTFVLPGVTLATLLCLRAAGRPVGWRRLGLFVGVTVVCALPFARIVMLDPENFFHGYIGSKIVAEGNPVAGLLGNLAKAALAFHVRGDSIFRSNPANAPHLDPLSGVLFLAGLGFWLMPVRRRWSPVLLVPFLLLQLPSVLVLGRPDEVPSASRTLGVAPIAYILVASGIWWIACAIARALRQSSEVPPRVAEAGDRGHEATPMAQDRADATRQSGGGAIKLLLRWAGPAVGAVLLGAIFLLNMQRYFGDYIGGLPYHDTSIGGQITAYAAMLPPETRIYLVGCCWEAGMPETTFVKLVAARPANIQELDPLQLNCDRLQVLKQPAVLIWSFHTELPTPQLEACRQWLPAQLYVSSQGLPMFHAAPLLRDIPVPVTEGQPRAPADQLGEQLEDSLIEIDGQMVEVRYSPIDMGQPTDLFDGNDTTLLRGREANPLEIELHFKQPRDISAIELDLTTMEQFRVDIDLTAADGKVISFEQQYRNLPADPHVGLPVPSGPKRALVVRIKIEDRRPRPEEGFHIHVREVRLR